MGQHAALVTSLALVLAALPAPPVLSAGPAALPVSTATAHTVTPRSSRVAARPVAASRAARIRTGSAVAGQHAKAAALARARAGRKSPIAAPSAQSAPSATTSAGVTPSAAVPAGIQDVFFSFSASNYRPAMPSVAVNGSGIYLEATVDQVQSNEPSSYGRTPEDFFGLPATEAAYDTHVVWNALHGRWVALTTSWQFDTASCASGFLNLAVSAGSNPAGAWKVWRVPLAGRWADRVSLGVSDDKIVMTDAEFALNANWTNCLDPQYLGARVRVVDWSAILAGSSAPVMDATPASPTHYWSWQAAATVPDVGSAQAGNDVALAVDRYDVPTLTWGNVVAGKVTGTVAGANVALSVTDLTATAATPVFDGPPYMSGDPTYQLGGWLGSASGLDEGPVNASARGGTLWVAANSTCTPAGDTTPRGCVRYLVISVGGAPAVLDDARVGKTAFDTFSGAATPARDGTVYLAYDRCDRPVYDYCSLRATVAWRDAGAPIGSSTQDRATTGGRACFLSDGGAFDIAATAAYDPSDPHAAFVAVAAPDNPYSDPSSCQTMSVSTAIQRLRGGGTGAPAGVLTSPAFAGYSDYILGIAPDPGSPVVALRLSNAPDTTAGPGGQQVLQLGTTFPATRSTSWGLTNPATGGTPASDSDRSFYYQWITDDGTYSDVQTASYHMDVTPPAFTKQLAGLVAPATLGTTAPVRFTWAAQDDAAGSGMQDYVLQSDCFVAGCSFGVNLPSPLTTTAVLAYKIGTTYHPSITAVDNVSNWTMSTINPIKLALVQETSTAIKFGGTWTRSSQSGASGGYVKTASKAGSTATYRFTGRSIGLVLTKGPGRGKVTITVDGVAAGTVDTYSSSLRTRQIVFSRAWATAGTHTIVVRVAGTSGRPRVDLDAFVQF